MNIHENARTTPSSRALLVRRVLEERWSARDAATAAGVSRRTAYKWLRRFQDGGGRELRDRTSRAHRIRHRVPDDWCSIIEYLRGFRQTAHAIGLELGIARSTVSAVLARRGLGPQSSLEPPRPLCRYERRRPGDLLHLDIKKLSRFVRPGHRVTGDRHRPSVGAGFDCVHVAIDDHSRIAYAEILPNEFGVTCAAFMRRAKDWFAGQGITIRELLTDNGTGYRSHWFREACAACRVKHLRTKPRTPQTNGKAERFIQTLLREWAYVRLYNTSDERSALLPQWIRRYNQERPHASLNYLPPFSRRPRSCEQRS